MAVTLAKVAHPNQFETTFEFGPFKAVLKTVTLDNAYVTTGEPVTAAQLGWNQLIGAILMDGGFATSTGAAMLPGFIKRAADSKSLTIQAYRYDGASAGKASMEEAANAFDASTFSGRVLFIGM